MRSILLIVILFMAIEGFAQEKTDARADELKFSARDSIVSDTENNTIRLYGAADFKYGRVHFVAEEIFINRKTKQVIATGLIAFSVPGIKGNINSTHKILTYTIGEQEVLML